MRDVHTDQKLLCFKNALKIVSIASSDGEKWNYQPAQHEDGKDVLKLISGSGSAIEFAWNGKYLAPVSEEALKLGVGL